ncbi:MAG: recombinase family protein [Chloroflexi bacterium]|nr:recombinase family protein [Chloroflexota bacterium]
MELRVTPHHLARNAYLYVRQSTLRQVVEHTESATRQYALRQRAIALGWPAEQIIVIDCDQGQSGASAADRAGFQQLVAEVGLGHAGIVLGLEVSRLARSSTDWHQLLELCALSQTLILDEDGLYDPGHFNDRLLLGLKGTMSEAELHVLRARLIGGQRSKARRGELKQILPIGFVYDPLDRVVFDPDQQVQQAIRLVFQAYRRTGSACRVVGYFSQEELLFPRRIRSGPAKGNLVWGPLTHDHVLRVLHNPRYAGAFTYGRTTVHHRGNGHLYIERLQRDEWQVLLRDAHAGYISWDEYEQNLQQLRQAAHSYGIDRRESPPREGPALLQGLVICGRCGNRMTVRYDIHKEREVTTYTCMRTAIQHARPVCQRVHGEALDAAIGDLLIESLTPFNLELTLAIQAEVQARIDDADRLRQQHVERARQEAELAQHRFQRVHPDNRLVADVLEAEWNARLRELADVQDLYQRQRAEAQRILDADERKAILDLATDLPRLWRDPRTPARERKRLARLLIEDVTLLRADQLTAHVRFRGGATHSLQLPLPGRAWQLRQAKPEVVSAIDELLNEHTDGEIAAILNERGLRSGLGLPFHSHIVGDMRRSYRLGTRFDRLRAAGLLDKRDMARLLKISVGTLKTWYRHGLITGKAYDDKGSVLYQPPTGPRPRRGAHKFHPRRPSENRPERRNEV